jgi:ParB/RepB/Spo0J family partition protein
MSDATYQVVPLEQLHESPLNPRKQFNAIKIEELAASIRVQGILSPLLVRPNADGFEIGSGHRRYRASKLAGLGSVPVLSRPMTDEEFLELLTIEQLQHEDLHPLEEAEGYRQLMKTAHYDVARIGARIGKSVKYVYDRVKLLELTPPATKLFLDGKMTAGHAILLARLKPKDQATAIDPHGRALFEHEFNLRLDDAEGPHEEPVKPRSVREFSAWIDEHVKFDHKTVDPMLFPETAAELATAKEKAAKVVQVTTAHYIDPDARDPKERIFFPMSWKRADGHQKSKACELGVTGVIVAGAGRGTAFTVCIEKEKCAVHWGSEIKERTRRQRAAGKAPGKPADPAAEKARRDKAEAQRALDEELGGETDKRFFAQLLGKIKGPLPREALLYLVEDSVERNYEGRDLMQDFFGKPSVAKPASLKADELGRMLLAGTVAFALADGYNSSRLSLLAKSLKVDRLAIAKTVQAEHQAKAKAAAPPAKKKAKQ